MQPRVGEASEEIADERRRKGQGGPTLFLRGLGLPDAPRMEVWTYICAGPWVDDILVRALVQATLGPALSLSDPLPANCVPSIITTDALPGRPRPVPSPLACEMAGFPPRPHESPTVASAHPQCQKCPNRTKV